MPAVITTEPPAIMVVVGYQRPFFIGTLVDQAPVSVAKRLISVRPKVAVVRVPPATRSLPSARKV